MHVSPGPPPTISYKDNWTCDLDSDFTRSSEDIQRIELKPNAQLSSKGTKFDRDILNQEKHDEVTDPTNSGKLVSRHQSTKRCVLTPKHVENNQTGTAKPVTVDQEEEHQIDFRVPGLSHSVVKEAEHLRIQELVKKIESHPHREALQADLQQNKSATHSSMINSKEIIREVDNVELFCAKLHQKCNVLTVFFWNQGIVYCICGQCLIDSESRRRFNKLRLDALSIPNVIKKGTTHGALHGKKTEVQREHHLAWNAWKRCCEKLDSQGEHFTGIHDRFLRSSLSWTTARTRMDRTTLQRVGWTWKRRPYIQPHSRGKEDAKDNGISHWTNEASIWLQTVIMKNRLHHESGEPIEEPIQPGQQRRTRRGQEIFSEAVQRLSWSVRVDQHTGWQYWPSFYF